MTDECVPNDSYSGAGRYVDQSLCILSYDGDFLDISLNYTMLILDVLMCGYLLRIQAQMRNDVVESRRIAITALISLALVSAFQLCLCLEVYCSGISIVWCAAFGWYLFKRPNCKAAAISSAAESSNSSSIDLNQQQEQNDVLYEEYTSATGTSQSTYTFRFLCTEALVGILNISLICYYALTDESITTIAHGCAILLGMFFALLDSLISCSSLMSCCCRCRCWPLRLMPGQARAGTDTITQNNNTAIFNNPEDPLLSSADVVPAYVRPETSTNDIFAPPTESLNMETPTSRESFTADNFSTSWLNNSFFRSTKFQHERDLITEVDERADNAP